MKSTWLEKKRSKRIVSLVQSTNLKSNHRQIITSLDRKLIPCPKQVCQQPIFVKNIKLHINRENQNRSTALKRQIPLQTKVLNKHLIIPKTSYANDLHLHRGPPPNISFPLFIDLSKENSPPRSPCRTYHTKQRNLPFAHANPL